MVSKECRVTGRHWELAEEGSSPGDSRGGVVLTAPCFQTFGFHRCEKISFCCVEPPSVWHFVTVALGGQCRDFGETDF